ncbi:MAG: hypothetical protein ACFLMY_10705 [Candidatus Brachytrichaceae bacterium NZ_4S206]|jgi:hypothetical protein
MDPLAIIAGALVAGAAAAAQEVVPQAIRDAYQGLKSLIIEKFGAASDVESATRGVEKKPGDPARQEVLKDELADAGAAQDAEVLQQAQALLDLVRQHAPAVAQQYSAALTGSGGIAQGASARAAGAGGVIVGGSNTGSINTGPQVETGGGAYVGGNVTAGRDFVGGDQINIYGSRRSDDHGIARQRDPREQKLYEAFEAVFSLDDLQDLAFTLGVDWDSLTGEAKGGKARALIDYFTKDGRFDVLYDAAKAKRPRYPW